MMMRAVAIEPSSSARRLAGVPVVIAEPAPMFRLGLVEAVERAEGFVLRAAVDDLSTAIAAVAHQELALCIAAAQLDDENFQRVTAARYTHPHLQFLMVMPAHAAMVDAETVLGAGILGLLEFSITIADLHAAMTAVAAGRTTWAPGVRLRPATVPTEEDSGLTLTRRERQVLTAMGQGLSNRAIAGALFISENTVKNHVRRIHEKLGVHTRTEAVVKAAHEGIVEITAT